MQNVRQAKIKLQSKWGRLKKSNSLEQGAGHVNAMLTMLAKEGKVWVSLSFPQ